MYSGCSWAYIVGVYLGDGCVYEQWNEKNGRGYPCFVLGAKDRDFIDATKAALESLSRYKVSAHTYQDRRFVGAAPTIRLRCGDPALCEELQSQTDRKKRIPDWLFVAPLDERRAFIAGLMDSEGYVCVKDSRRGATLGFKSTDVWFEEFLTILRSAGISHGRVGVEKPRKAGYRTPRRVSLKLASWVAAGAYFNIARKQERVDRWAAMPRYGRMETNTA